MFVLDEQTIEKLSEDGLYDYFTDIEDEGKLLLDDVLLIYQYTLLYLQHNLSPCQMKEYLHGLNKQLKEKKEAGF